MDINGYYVDATEKQLFSLMLSITRGSRQETTRRSFKKHIKKVQLGSDLGWWERKETTLEHCVARHLREDNPDNSVSVCQWPVENPHFWP